MQARSTTSLARLLTVRWLVTLAALAACVAVYAFAATGSPNPVQLRNAAGTLSVSNDKSGAAILSVGGAGSPVGPGGSSQGTVTIGNGGDTTGALTLSKSDIADSVPGLAG